MSYLKLIGLVCEKTQEAVDEVYLTATVDGQDFHRIWGGARMDDGDAKRVPWGQTFDHRMSIELHEWDAGGRGDLIGTLTVADRPAHDGERPAVVRGEESYVFMGRHAQYRLTYSITHDPPRDDYVLTLVSLRCNDAQEITDQPYLTVNGVVRWGSARFKTGSVATILQDVPFDQNATIELWERDPSVSDRIGSHTVDFREATLRGECGDLTLQFKRDRGIVGDASYTLTYRVKHVGP